VHRRKCHYLCPTFLTTAGSCVNCFNYGPYDDIKTARSEYINGVRQLKYILHKWSH